MYNAHEPPADGVEPAPSRDEADTPGHGDPFPGSNRPEAPERRPPPTWLVLTTGAVAVAFVATGLWAFSVSRELERARNGLAKTEATARGLQADLAAEQAERADLAATASVLQERTLNQDDCIANLLDWAGALANAGAKTEEALMVTSVESTYEAANLKREAAVRAALDAYFDAYQAAWEDRYSDANGLIDEGNAHVAEANAQRDIMAAELATGNTALDEATVMLNDLDANPVDLSVCS